MLKRIEIRNFAIIQSLDLNWSSGMTVITGETGAGKSIVIDALGLTMGEKAEQNAIYPHAKQAEVTTIFHLSDLSAAAQWLKAHELDEEDECILRRVIVKGGRTRCFINGRSVTQSQLKSVASLLVDIHGQHAQQSLLKPKEQLNLLDRYASHANLLEKVKTSAQKINEIQTRKKRLLQEKLAKEAKRELLTYQVEELTLANPEASILNTLELEHKQMATSQDRLELANAGLQWLDSENPDSTSSSLSRVLEQVQQLQSMDDNLKNLHETLLQAESLIQEAKQELSQYCDTVNCDPEKLRQLDEKLTLFHDLARKHHVTLDLLPDHFLSLSQELAQLQADESELLEIEKAYQLAVTDYQTKAEKLTHSRQINAKKLEKEITKKLQGLAMEGGILKICLVPINNQFSSSGAESIEFQVSANPGQPLQRLDKVASGGELSRISLAIAVVTSEQQLIPCIIFDEVDVGIGGGTAETVGKLLNQLGIQKQVICVTHQPQVAACGNQHLVASKTKQAHSTTNRVKSLNQSQRTQEIARMLGGLVISEKTLSHAKEMLKQQTIF